MIWIALMLLFSAAQAGAQSEPPKPVKPPEPKVASGKAPAKPRPRVIVDLSGFELSDAVALRKQTMVVGATRGFGKASPIPVLYAPLSGKSFSARPEFFWSLPQGMGSGIFILSDADLNEIFRRQVTGNSFSYPADAPRLLPGKTYYWRVETKPASGEPKVSLQSSFSVLGGEERRMVETELKAVSSAAGIDAALKYAEILTKHRLWYDTIAAYSALIRQHPKRADLYELRGMIYAQLDATHHLADLDFQAADSIQASATVK
jgi:hypothetical protein